jgi:calcineurin-like phosphoesterase family protein
MRRQAYDRNSVDQYVEAVRQRLPDAALSDSVSQAAAAIPGSGDPVAKVSAALPGAYQADASSGGGVGGAVPYLAREPAVSLVQSSVESALRQRGVPDQPPGRPGLWQKIVQIIEGFLHRGNFGPDDADWVIKIAEAALGHLAKGNHPFNPKPAEHSISGSARLVVVGDWGTGLPRARAVARYMAEEVADALGSGREAHVIHLGDVYYSGLPEEVQRHVLQPWPVTAAQARAGVTSWSLNGNHDMYSGGYGYYDTLLADPRFAAQHSADGAATSFFRLTAPGWEFVGLDTSWDTDVLSQGASGVLQDPQGSYVAEVAKASDRKLVLLSHHQLTTVYDQADIGPVLTAKLGPVLDSGRVTAWWWGHEHRCVGFEATRGVRFPRCIGHGGVPVLQTHTDADKPPAPWAWEPSGYLDSGGQRWALFGFAVFDLDGDRIQARYRDEHGATIRTEVIE